MSLGSHQQSIGKSQVHITPKWIIDALGSFDLDPCGNDLRPWDCAHQSYTANGLMFPWFGRVWLNPPFDRREVGQWIARLAEHGDGIALLHARTETAWFRPIWERADAILFLDKRLTFHKPDGSLCTTLKGEPANSGAPPVLVAFGIDNAVALRRSGIGGALLHEWNVQ